MAPNRLTRRVLAIAAPLAIALVALGGTALAAGSTPTGALALKAELSMQSGPGVCPPGTDPSIECRARQGTGLVPGLGQVAEAYDLVVHTSSNGCTSGEVRVLGSAARFTIAGKGTLDLALGESPGCFTPEAALNTSRPFTVTGGTGAYLGASGGGSVVHRGHYTDSGAAGVDTWTGDLVVPDIAFDTTPPVLSGATSKTVRAKKNAARVRVVYSVTASDEADGARAVSCSPRSGSSFKRGRTRVTCSAADTSGNTANASFTITVKAGR